jgi:hypothetical protein
MSASRGLASPLCPISGFPIAALLFPNPEGLNILTFAIVASAAAFFARPPFSYSSPKQATRVRLRNCPDMDDRARQLAADYRRRAASCQEVAERMSVHADRDLMLEMAEKWLELARKIEREGDEQN